MPGKVSKIVHGDDLLYRFFGSLIEDRPDLADEVLLRMYTSMGIWFPLDVYHRLPVMLPWVVRDPSCRGNKAKGLPDEWGAPNNLGFFRDDNSLVKALTRSLRVHAVAMPHLHGAKMGTEFVASHIWRVGKSGELVSRNPILNSFVPNLVWLPSQVAKLTDREGSVMQYALQAIAWRRYRNAPVHQDLKQVVEEAWENLPAPAKASPVVKAVNEFVATDLFLQTRRDKIRSVIQALELIATGSGVSGKVISTRYTEGLPNVSAAERRALLLFLQSFATDTLQ